MLKLNDDNEKNIIAYIVDKKNKIVSNVHEKCKDGEIGLAIPEKYHFQLAPRPLNEQERMTLFIAGESGAGKSYFIREYAKFYNKMFPKNEIFLISYLEQDETLDAFKKINRLKVCENVEFLENINKLDIKTEFENTLVIFDDIDAITNKNAKSKIYGLLNKLLRIYYLLLLRRLDSYYAALVSKSW
jgi:Cdc6-like AAA superfamily ATPase